VSCVHNCEREKANSATRALSRTKYMHVFRGSPTRSLFCYILSPSKLYYRSDGVLPSVSPNYFGIVGNDSNTNSS
jgi:hypothetical protein